MEGTFKEVLKEVLEIRGRDLGAYYAKGSIGDLPDIFSTLSKVIGYMFSYMENDHIQSILRASYDLFQNPDKTESIILSQLGRITFAIQLVLQSPCETLFIAKSSLKSFI